MAVHSGRSCGTVEETIDASMSSKESPRSSSRLRSAAPSSSAVESRTVAKRQCCTRRSPSKAPSSAWVCVLPASTTRSIGGEKYARSPWPRPSTSSRGLTVARRSSGRSSSRRSSTGGSTWCPWSTALVAAAALRRGDRPGARGRRRAARRVPAHRAPARRARASSRGCVRATPTCARGRPRRGAGATRSCSPSCWRRAVPAVAAACCSTAAALRRAPARWSYAAGARLPVPPRIAARAGGVVAALSVPPQRRVGPNVRADLIHLPRHLDRIDRWIGAGVLGGEDPNARPTCRSGRACASRSPSATWRRSSTRGRPAGWRARSSRASPGHVPAGTLPGAWLAAAAGAA